MKTKRQYTLGEIYLLKQDLTSGSRRAKRNAYRILTNIGIEIEKTVEPASVLKTVYKVKEAVGPVKEVTVKKNKKVKTEKN